MTNSQRIAKNTLLLSVRMILVLIVSLYTVRVILNTLGVVDYGIYNVVGGAVLFFSFLSNTMSRSTQRFFSYELGKKDGGNLKEMFQLNFTVYILIITIVVFLSATVGIWFLDTQMVIPENRINAAYWIYSSTLVSFVIRMLVTPYQAVLISYEKMGLFAWLSIVEVFLLLIIVFLLQILPFDKLKCYAILNLSVTLIVNMACVIICRLRFQECRLGINLNKTKLSQIVSFTGFSLYGHSATALRSYGVNILLNLFFGPAMNAARGIAYQAYNAINTFVNNFTVALNPQIVKSYAAEQRQEMFTLMVRGSKISYFIILLLTTPVMLQTSYIFTLWLKEVPEHTVFFTRLVLIMAIIDAISIPLTAAFNATGKIKRFQLVVGSILYGILPLSWVFLKMGFPPETPLMISVGASLLLLWVKSYLAKKSYQFPLKMFWYNIVFKLSVVTVLSYLFPILLIIYIGGEENFVLFSIISIVSILSTVISFYLIAMEANEKRYVHKWLQSKMLNLKAQRGCLLD